MPGEHIDAEGHFQSDKYPSVPPDLVPLKVTDPDAQDLLATYALRRARKDEAFASDLLWRLAQGDVVYVAAHHDAKAGVLR